MTSLVSDAVICSEVPATAYSNYTTESNADVQSIKDYFARPAHIAAGDVTSGTGLLYSLDIGRDTGFVATLFGNSAAQRLTGAAGMRATIRITVQVTATPFHQGILCLNAQYSTTSVTSNDKRRSFTPLSVNIPHVMLDIAETTSVSLDIPYVSPYDYFTIPTPLGMVGWHVSVGLNKLTDVRVVAGQTAPTYNVYASLHDIEMIGVYPATTSIINLQSGVPTSNNGVSSSRSARPLVSGSSKITQEARAAGVVSKTLNAAANVADAVGMIPGLSAIGGAADWFLRSSAGAFASFGFSKPIDENRPERHFRQNYAGDSQVDIPETAYAVAPFQGNKLAVSPVLGCTDEDEMAFDRILSIPSLIFRGDLSTADSIGDLVYGAHVTPACFWYRDFASAGTPTGNIAMPSNSTLTTNAILPSTLMYVSNNFRYWRGNLRFTFKFSKSKLHGARVLVSYCPYASIVGGTSAPIGNAINFPEQTAGRRRIDGLSTVIDIRDESTFDFVVPYTYPLPYCSTTSEGIGSITMTVMDKLVTSSVLASTIDFLVFVSAEPGFEFANVCPATLDGPGGGTVVVLQSGIGGVKIASDACQHVIGEKINSIKQLVLIPDFNTGPAIAANSYNVWDADPWYKANSVTLATPIGNAATVAFYASKCGRLSRMYTFVNGATKYVMQSNRTSQALNITVRQYPSDCGTDVVGFSSLYDRDFNPYGGVAVPESDGTLRFTLPAYARTSRIPINEINFNGLCGSTKTGIETAVGVYKGNFGLTKYQIGIRNGDPTATTRIITGIAAADDSRLAGFIGPPPALIFPSTSTTGPTNVGSANF